MKKYGKRLEGLFVAFVVVVLCVLGNPLIAGANDTNSSKAKQEESKEVPEDVIKVYYHLTDEWEDVNIWSWTMETTVNLAKNPWPGDEMKKLDNNWYVAEIVSDENIGVVFADHAGNQTSDCKDLEPGTIYWITNGSEEQANDSGLGGGASLTAVKEPKAGWPEGPAVEEKEEDDNNTVLIVMSAIVIACVVVLSIFLIVEKKKGARKQ